MVRPLQSSVVACRLVSHKVAGWTCIHAPTTSATTTPATTTYITSPSESVAIAESDVSAMDDPITVAAITTEQTCNWASCTKSCTGFNGHTLFWVSPHVT
jgi:hypothetical protein